MTMLRRSFLQTVAGAAADNIDTDVPDAPAFGVGIAPKCEGFYYVVDETLTMLRFRLGLAETEAWWHQVAGSSHLRWEYISLERADKARDLFFRYTDKEFSFTDCTSFVVMRELKLREVLTTDHHFAQAGFLTLPRA